MITVIGTGTGAPPSVRDAEALDAATLVVGARRHLTAARVPAAAEQVAMGPLGPALDAIEKARADGAARVVVLASGDPGFFGIVRVLAERFGADALDVRPGAASVAVAFARVGLPWDDAVVVSAHGRDLRTAVNVCRAYPKTAVLTGPGAGPAELGAELAYRSADRVLVVASALGDPERERVERLTPAQAAEREWDAVSVVLCLDESRSVAAGQRTVAGRHLGPSRWALDESAFAHRDSMITKFEVRALALARLGPRTGDLSGTSAPARARWPWSAPGSARRWSRWRRPRTGSDGSGPTRSRTAWTSTPCTGRRLPSSPSFRTRTRCSSAVAAPTCPPSSRPRPGGPGAPSWSRWRRWTGCPRCAAP